MTNAHFPWIKLNLYTAESVSFFLPVLLQYRTVSMYGRTAVILVTVITTNEAVTIESSCQVAVSPKQTAPQIIDGPASVTVKEKETAEFKASHFSSFSLLSVFSSLFFLFSMFPTHQRLYALLFLLTVFSVERCSNSWTTAPEVLSFNRHSLSISIMP